MVNDQAEDAASGSDTFYLDNIYYVK